MDAPTAVARLLGGDIDGALAGVGLVAWIADRDGTLVWQNERSLGLFGDRRGKSILDYVEPESVAVARTEFVKHLFRRKSSHVHVVLRDREHRRVPLDLHVVALMSGKHVVGLLGIGDAGPPLPPASVEALLTPRQLQVLRLLGRGHSTAEIAARLNLATHTVRNHIASLLGSLGVHSRLEAVAEGRRRGLIV